MLCYFFRVCQDYRYCVCSAKKQLDELFKSYTKQDPPRLGKLTKSQCTLRHFLLVIRSKGVSFLHHFGDINTFAVYVTSG